MIRTKVLLAASILAIATPSLACDNYPDLPPLPGETTQETKARNDHLWQNSAIVADYEGQQLLLKQAKRIYLARVVMAFKGNSVSVEAAHSIRGVAPAKHRMLSETGFSSCGPWGDGEATRAKIGDWVIVFEGLPRQKERPRGVASIFAKSALVWELVEEIEKFSRAQSVGN